jgi:hypothetical protein
MKKIHPLPSTLDVACRVLCRCRIMSKVGVNSILVTDSCMHLFIFSIDSKIANVYTCRFNQCYSFKMSQWINICISASFVFKPHFIEENQNFVVFFRF